MKIEYIKPHQIIALFGMILISCATPEIEVSVESDLDPLPSWSESENKQAILDYVEVVTEKNSTNYIPEEDRIATFDNDGTLWSEQPYYFQLRFAIDQVKSKMADNPDWQKDEILSAAASENISKLLSFGEEGLIKLIMASHSGMSEQEFSQEVSTWINTAKHPDTGKLYKEMVYQPMLEVLDFLRNNGFKTFIVSGGGIDFMRPWTQEVYGIPTYQVVGSSLKSKFESTGNEYKIIKVPEMNFIDDKEGKPVGIHQHIGKTPVMAFGNSDGDLQMLQYSSSSKYKSLQVYIHHTDETREWAYDRGSHIGDFDKGWDEAEEKGWVVVDMKNDWERIFPE